MSGSTLSNITPLETTTTTIANSLDTHYDTLSGNPLSLTAGSNNVVVTDGDAELFALGDNYVLSGAVSAGGIPIAEINKTHVIRAIGTNTVTIKTASNATVTTLDGGALIDRSRRSCHRERGRTWPE